MLMAYVTPPLAAGAPPAPTNVTVLAPPPRPANVTASV